MILATSSEITSLLSPQAAIALVTLTLLEIVLGIDNIVFISILSKKLPADQSDRARLVGLGLAMGMRILLLLSISWIMGLTAPLPVIGTHLSAVMGDQDPGSWRDLILFTGGLFLIYKSVVEIHEKLEGEEHPIETRPVATFSGVLVQILLLDIVFSLDSVITAVGMVQTTPEHHWIGLSIMITAIVIAVAVMMFASKPIADFVEAHPTVKMLALSFLLLIGVVLIADSNHRHVPKGYVYFAMAFSLGVEMLNLKLRKRHHAAHPK